MPKRGDWRWKVTGIREFAAFPAADRLDDARHFAGAEDRIDFRDFLLELVAITLGQAPGDDQAPARRLLLQLGHLENRVDRLLLGPIDERTGVDDEHVGAVGFRRDLVARLFGQAKHHLGVDEILRAPEGDEADFHRRCNPPVYAIPAISP